MVKSPLNPHETTIKKATAGGLAPVGSAGSGDVAAAGAPGALAAHGVPGAASAATSGPRSKRQGAPWETHGKPMGNLVRMLTL